MDFVASYRERYPQIAGLWEREHARARIYKARLRYMRARAELAQVNRRPDLPRGPYLAACRRAYHHLQAVTRAEHFAMLRRERNHYRRAAQC